MSGVLVGAPVSLILKKELVIVRKPGEQNHQFYGGTINARALHASPRCLFLDDLISMGDTRKRVLNGIQAHGGVLVGNYLYQTDWYEGKDV
jgi:adenine/guanine phosphoribosyltransferase-like PRPP-binding protein